MHPVQGRVLSDVHLHQVPVVKEEPGRDVSDVAAAFDALKKVVETTTTLLKLVTDAERRKNRLSQIS